MTLFQRKKSPEVLDISGLWNTAEEKKKGAEEKKGRGDIAGAIEDFSAQEVSLSRYVKAAERSGRESWEEKGKKELRELRLELTRIAETSRQKGTSHDEPVYRKIDHLEEARDAYEAAAKASEALGEENYAIGLWNKVEQCDKAILHFKKAAEA